MGVLLTRWRPALCIALIACLYACDRDAPDDDGADTVPAAPAELTVTPAQFDTADAYLRTRADTLHLRVEIARTSDQRAYGLMDRDNVADGTGMVFLYDDEQPGSAGFWMYRTRVPLDIAFFDGSGRISVILQMSPCTSASYTQCPAYQPGQPYYGALEVPRGYFERNNVAVGDQVVVTGHVGG